MSTLFTGPPFHVLSLFSMLLDTLPLDALPMGSTPLGYTPYRMHSLWDALPIGRTPCWIHSLSDALPLRHTPVALTLLAAEDSTGRVVRTYSPTLCWMDVYLGHFQPLVL